MKAELKIRLDKMMDWPSAENFGILFEDINRERPELWANIKKFSKNRDVPIKETILTAIELLV